MSQVQLTLPTSVLGGKEDFVAMQTHQQVTDPKQLFLSTINNPVMVCWPRAMRNFTRDEMISELYPNMARNRYFGKKKFVEMFKLAKEEQDSVNILGLRLDLMEFLRTFNSQSRDIWKQDQRIFKIASIIATRALDPFYCESLKQLQEQSNFSAKLLQNAKHEFRLGFLDAGQRTGFLVTVDKRHVKDATCKLMEELRYLARAKCADELFGISTTLYEWQFVHYSRKGEIAGEKDFFTASEPYPCYYKNLQYTYTDLDIKLIVALIRNMAKLAISRKSTAIDDLIM